MGFSAPVRLEQGPDAVLVVSDHRDRHFHCGRQQLVVRDHLGHQANAQCRGGIDEVARQAHPASEAAPDRGGQPGGQTPAGQHSDTGVRVGEPGALGGDEEVASQRQLQTAGDGRPVDRPDHRLRQRTPGMTDGNVRRSDPGGVVPGRAELTQIQARAERRIGAGQDDHVHAIVAVRRGEFASQCLDQMTGQCVSRGRAMQREDANPATLFGEQHRPLRHFGAGHVHSSSSSRPDSRHHSTRLVNLGYLST